MNILLIFLSWSAVHIAFSQNIISILDNGVDPLGAQQTTNPSPQQPAKDKELENIKQSEQIKMYIYQRVKLNYDENQKIELHQGMNKKTFTTIQPMLFKIDLSTNSVLIKNTKECLEEEGCFKVNEGKKDFKIYQGNQLDYYQAKTFIGVNRIRPGELNVDSYTDLGHFLELNVLIYSADRFNDNVIGLSPSSSLWSYWSSIYHFPQNKINISILTSQDHNFLLFDSKIEEEKEILFQVKKNSNNYLFKGHMNYMDKTLNIKNQEVNVCVANEAGMTLRFEKSFFNQIKETLCKDPSSCGKCSDIQPEPKLFLELIMEDYRKKNGSFTRKYFLSSLYTCTDDKLQWNINQIETR